MEFFELRDEAFREWLKRTENAFIHMIQTMKKVAKVVEENTAPKTPVRSTKLVRSFKYTVVTDNSRMKVLEVSMSALNERTGYDYAMTQHRGYHISKNGYYVRYNQRKNMVSSDSHMKYSAVYNNFNFTTHWGQPYYLRDGVRESEDGAFQLIEEDYLSLFTRGNIY